MARARRRRSVASHRPMVLLKMMQVPERPHVAAFSALCRREDLSQSNAGRDHDRATGSVLVFGCSLYQTRVCRRQETRASLRRIDLLDRFLDSEIHRKATGGRETTGSESITAPHARTHARTPFKAPVCARPRQIQSLLLAALLSRYLSFRSLIRMPFRSALAIHSAGCRVDRVSE